MTYQVKIKGYVHCKSGNISEMVQDRILLWTTNRKWYMVYRIAAVWMNLSGIQGHSLTAVFSSGIFVHMQQLTRFQLT